MSDLSVSSWSAGNVQLVSEGGRFSFRTGQAQGNQGISNAMLSAPAIKVYRQDQRAFARNLPIQNVTTVGGLLLAALNAMGSLKVRVLDSHNHGVQTEILKLVKMANSNDEYANEAKEILVALAQNETTKSIFTRSLASTIGGAKWVQDARTKSGSGESGMASAADAAKVLLALTDGENPPLTHDECTKIHQQLNNHKVFSTEEAPIWEATQSLSIEERQQLGDCFGEHPRSVYEKSKKRFSLRDKREKLSKKINDCCRQDPRLRNLDGNFKCFGINLQRNGFNVPTSPNDLKQQDFSKERLAGARADIEEFLPAWQKFQADPNDSSLTGDQRTLCEAIQKAQKLSTTDEGETIGSLESQMNVMEAELPSGCPYLTSLVLDFPPQEAALRRALMAGDPDATIADCWDAITSQEDQFQKLGTYREFTDTLKELNALFLVLEKQSLSSREGLSLPQFLTEVTNLSDQFEKFHDLFEKEILLNSLQADVLRQLGGLPEEVEDFPIDDGLPRKVSEVTQHLLEEINQHLYPGQEPPNGMSPRRSIEQYLEGHPEMDATQQGQIQRILEIAAKLKIEG